MNKLKQLCEQYESTDSISKKEDLKEKILDLGKKYLKKKYEISEKYNLTRDFFPSDYRNDSGHFSSIDVWSDKVVVGYEDSWAYGGSCCESLLIGFEKYENFNEREFDQSCKRIRGDRMKTEIERTKRHLESLERDYDKFLNS